MSGTQLQRMLRRHSRRHLTGRATINRRIDGVPTPVATGVWCRVLPSQRATTEVDSGGSQVAMAVYDVEVPYATDIRRGDGITLTKSYDAFQVGWWCTIVEVLVDETVTNRIAVGHRSNR